MIRFVDELAAATRAERARLLATPIIGEEPAGRVNRGQYLSFLMQAHCYVSHAASVPRVVAASLPPWHNGIRAVVASYGDELAARADLLAENISILGGDAYSASRCRPAPETSALIDYAEEFATRVGGVGFLGLIYVAEGTVASLAAVAADRIRLALQLPRAAITYLTRCHQAFDPASARRLEALLNGITRPDERAAIIRSAKTAFDLNAAVLRRGSRHDLPVREPRDGERLRRQSVLNA